MDFKDFKDKIRFLRTFKDRANFFRNLRNLRTSGRPGYIRHALHDNVQTELNTSKKSTTEWHLHCMLFIYFCSTTHSESSILPQQSKRSLSNHNCSWLLIFPGSADSTIIEHSKLSITNWCMLLEIKNYLNRYKLHYLASAEWGILPLSDNWIRYLSICSSR